jgi:hypothetical protein
LIVVSSEIRLGGHAAVWTSFLLEVRKGEAERDECMELTLRPVLRSLGEFRFNAQECCKNNDDHDHHGHDGEGENEAKATSRHRVGCDAH